MNTIIVQPKKIEKIKKQWREEGCDRFHILVDFDRTLTYAFVDGQKSPTVIAQIRNGDYLSPEYNTKAHAMFDHYAPIERDPNISWEEKNTAMRQWWAEHFKLLVDSGLTKETMIKIVAQRTLKLRADIKEFFDWAKEKNVPIIIMSAAPQTMIEQYLKQEDLLYPNVHIIANAMNFDDTGKFVGITEPIIHSLNKYEIVLKDFPIFETTKDRTNVLLIGDQIDDVGMIEGFSYKSLLKIGFLNDPEPIDPAVAKQFEKNYDIILTGDPGLKYINNLLRETF